MQAAELWWSGKDDALSTKLDKMAPACFRMDEVLQDAMVKTSKYREGIAWKLDILNNKNVAENLAYFSQWKVTMEASIAATESTERAESAINKLRATVESFRGAIKNDMSSMKAASERVQNEVSQMRDRYKQAQDLLSSPEFVKAIENAERMAKALESIQQLTETKVSVAVFAGGKQQ